MNNDLIHSIINLSYSISHEMKHSWKHCSFICRRNSIISIGRNIPFKSHPIAKQFSYRYNSIHSELNAILNFNYPIRDLYKYYIVNTRIGRNNEIKLSKPCTNCQKLLYAFHIKEIWYTTTTGQFIRQV